ncbi:hypothetical protein QFC22_003112 [Naganishia vaughanmartiniae]|uniref:Uncharacterized protein n=1 Tax=Naganishia vaughanmartiniae TaxID=1424756 RepID=A0ACC2XBU1_9TREE|nr:hypothetical protein QFC22_003112 [Naganishia vaughanmartiniae]
MPSFSFANPLSGRRAVSAQDRATSKQHKSKLSIAPAAPSLPQGSSVRQDLSSLPLEQQFSNLSSGTRPSISASSSTQDVRQATYINNLQAVNVSSIGRKNIAGLSGEQKIVAVLINRLVSKLPASTGSSLGTTEADPIVQQTIAALEKISETKLALVAHGLTTVLEGFVPQTANLALANQPIHVLQSQYVILRTMQHCTTAYWKYHHLQNPTTTFAFRSETEGYPRPWFNPPAIEESLARFMVATLVLYIRMTTYEVTSVQSGVRGRTAPVPGTFGIKGENEQTPMGRSMLRFLHGFSTSADVGLKYRTEQSMEGKAHEEGPGGLMVTSEGTDAEFSHGPSTPATGARGQHQGRRRRQSSHSINTMASAGGSTSAATLMCEIARQVGKIFYFLSSAAWSVVYGNIRGTLLKLDKSAEEHPDAVEIRILEWSNLDQTKLTSVIKDFASHFLHIKRSVQPALSVAVHSAIWNWVEAYPVEFTALHKKGKRVDGGAETLFDIIHGLATTGNGPQKAKAFWPTQAALLLLCPDILDKAIHGETGSSVTKKASFLENLRKTGKASYMDEPTLLCYVDFCKAGSIIPLGSSQYALHEYVRDVRSDFQERLLHDTNVIEVLDINLLICGFVALHRSRFLDSRAWSPMLAFLKEAKSLKCRKVIAHSALILILESDNQPHGPPLLEIQTAAAPFFRAWLCECIAHWTSEGNWKPTYEVDLNVIDIPTYMAREKILLDAILKLYAAEPAFAFDGTGVASGTLGIPEFLVTLSKGAFHLRSPETAKDCERSLLALQNWIFSLPENAADTEAQQLSVSLISLLGPDFDMNARTIRALGTLARYRKDASSTIDRDMQVMRESASSVFEHICENLEGVFGKL